MDFNFGRSWVVLNPLTGNIYLQKKKIRLWGVFMKKMNIFIWVSVKKHNMLKKIRLWGDEYFYFGICEKEYVYFVHCISVINPHIWLVQNTICVEGR